MSKPALLVYGLVVITVLSCSTAENTGKEVSAKQKKFYVQPVYLTVSGMGTAVYIIDIFKEAFGKRKVRVITKDEFTIMIENESKRVAEKVKTELQAKPGKDIEEFKKAMAREHRYVSNMVNIAIKLEQKDDSLMIYKVSWSNMPFPPDFNRSSFLGTKSRPVDLTNLSYSLKENIYSIVDSILYSKELK